MSPRTYTDEASSSAAAHWLVLRQSGDMSDDDVRRFDDWLNESEQHGRAFAQIRRLWGLAGAVADEPAIVAARAANGGRAGRKGNWWTIWGVAASFLLVMPVGWKLFETTLLDRDRMTWTAREFQAPPRQRSEIALADGSVVTLDSGARMIVRATPAERRVELKGGRAYFRVAKDPGRPFIVLAEGRSVRAVGTAFAVSIDGADVTVTLTEGKVRVTGASSKTTTGVEMIAGRQLVARPGQWSLRPVDTSKETSWVSGQLSYSNDPLSTVVADMNRYSTRKVRFAEGPAPDRRIVGVFRAGDVGNFVKALELNGIAHVVAVGDKEILLSGDTAR